MANGKKRKVKRAVRRAKRKSKVAIGRALRRGIAVGVAVGGGYYLVKAKRGHSHTKLIAKIVKPNRLLGNGS